jgi:hypothetical protein
MPNATALTLVAGIAPVTPPVTPPVIPPVTPPVIVELSGAASAAVAQAQIAAGTLEADLPASQTDMTLSPPELASDIVVAASANFDQGAVSTDLSPNGVDMDTRVVINPLVPSLRVVRGGVKLPPNLVDVNTP